MQIRVLSYNIHKGIGGIDRKYKPERIIKTIKLYNPDIALLQEVSDGSKRSGYHRQVDLIADELDFEHRLFQSNVKRKTGSYGNAILSNYHLSNSLSIDLTVPPKKRRKGLAAQITITKNKSTRKLMIVNVHLGLAAYERAIQVCELVDNKFVKNTKKHTPILLGGDFNDVWENLCRKVLNAEGFYSIPKKAKTFPAIYPTRSLDRIFHRGDIVVEKFFVGRAGVAREASDHLPIIVDFKLT